MTALPAKKLEEGYIGNPILGTVEYQKDSTISYLSREISNFFSIKLSDTGLVKRLSKRTRESSSRITEGLTGFIAKILD